MEELASNIEGIICNSVYMDVLEEFKSEIQYIKQLDG